MFIPRDKGLEGLCFRSEYMKKDSEAYPIQQIISTAQHDSGLSFNFSYEIASRAVDILAGQDDWEEISEAVDSSVPVYNSDIAEIYSANAWAVDDAINEFGASDDADSIQRAQLGWFYAIENMARSIAGELEELIDEDDVCEKCGEIHDVEKAGGHDLIQANKVLLCECSEHPDDEYCKEVLKNEEVDVKNIPY